MSVRRIVLFAELARSPGLLSTVPTVLYHHSFVIRHDPRGWAALKALDHLRESGGLHPRGRKAVV